MKGISDPRYVLVSDRSEFAKRHKRRLPQTSIVPLNEFVPNGEAALFAVARTSVSRAWKRFRKITTPFKNQSIMTGRLTPGDPLLANRLSGAVFIPWCDDEIYVRWVKFLLGFPGIAISPQWFFAKNFTMSCKPALEHLCEVFDALTAADISDLKATILAEKYPCTRRTLERFCRQLFCTTPGYLCRVLRVFARTAEFMRKEQQFLANGSKRKSPLACLDGDYLDSLELVTGLRYADLRLAAEKEHWVAVWMRAWREKSNAIKAS